MPTGTTSDPMVAAIAAFIVNNWSRIIGFMKSATRLVAKFVAGHVREITIVISVPTITGVPIAAFIYTSRPDFREDVGGLDIAGYCDSYKFATGSERECSSPIDLNKACEWQHSQPGAVYELITPGNPHSGACFLYKGIEKKEKEKLGGIYNMPGYCKDLYKRSIGVRATLGGGTTWICRIHLNQKLVCAWQNNTLDVKAKKDSEGLWHCWVRRPQ